MAFSLANNRKLTEEGAIFQSHIDGSKHLFTPENVMDIQRTIGGDIIMALTNARLTRVIISMQKLHGANAPLVESLFQTL